MSDHTPGPWEIDPYRGGRSVPQLAEALEFALGVLEERHQFSRVDEALRIGRLALSKAGRLG